MQTTTTTTPQFVKDIYSQLGGHKFLYITGSKIQYYSNEDQSLTLKLSRNAAKSQYLKIAVGSMDTYTMTFTAIKKTVNKQYSLPGIKKIYNEIPVTVKEFKGIYCDQLQPLFTQITGLYTNLF